LLDTIQHFEYLRPRQANNKSIINMHMDELGAIQIVEERS
jgi:hypothetical protein